MGSLGEGRAYAAGSEKRVDELRKENIDKRPPVCSLVYSCPPLGHLFLLIQFYAFFPDIFFPFLSNVFLSFLFSFFLFSSILPTCHERRNCFIL